MDCARNDIPYGYCHCGCGQKTKLMPHNCKTTGMIKGKPYRFICGHSRRSPISGRLWSKINKCEENECWNWTGYKDKNGYGKVHWNGKSALAHRVVYELTFGKIPDDLILCHKCNNSSCCNPLHLYAGDHLDNILDCMNAGNYSLPPPPPCGSANSNAKLKEDDIPKIRSLYKTGAYAKAVIGTMFGVGECCIHNVITGKTWKHVL